MALAILLLSGCAAPAPREDVTSPRPPSIVCPDPCARPIDSGNRWEPSVAVDPADPLHIVASSHDQARDPATTERSPWALSHVSFDGGLTWTTVRLPGGPTSPPTHPLHAYNQLYDSALAFLSDGTLLWSAIATTGSDNRALASATIVGFSLVVLRSLDGGLTFPEAVTLESGSGLMHFHRFDEPESPVGVAAVAQDKQWFAVGPDGTVLLAWSRNAGGHPDCTSPMPDDECTEIHYAISTDGGRTWSRIQTLLGDGIYSGAFPLILDDGAWLVSFRDTTRQEVHVARSTDRGATWTHEAIDESSKFPVLAKSAGPAGERVYMAYPAGQDGPDGDQVVTLRWSDDGGASWSAPLPLDEPEAEGRTIPAIAPAGNGAWVSYWHVTGEGAQLRAVLVRDGLVSPSLTLGAHEGSTAATGDYMGLAPLPDGGAFAVWNARHDGVFTVTGARLGAS